MSIKTWEARIKEFNAGEPIKNSLINALRSIFNRPMIIKAKPEAAMLEGVVLYEYGYGPGWSITDEQTAKGLKWLRASKNMKHLPDDCRDILADFAKFTFEGLWLDWRGLRQEASVVYRVYAESGSYFDYTAYWWMDKATDKIVIIKTHKEA